MYLIEILHQTTTEGHAQTRTIWLYLIEILHQTTTSLRARASPLQLYLIEILHQTTTLRRSALLLLSCILSKFYIKPQQRVRHRLGHSVVSYRNSTSNHNRTDLVRMLLVLYLIEILHQTTTETFGPKIEACCILSKFYIKPQPGRPRGRTPSSCILSKFYIKPQQCAIDCIVRRVVSYRNSTSNHNNKERA